jgi:GNAT superfamily N-acetyltransferase
MDILAMSEAGFALRLARQDDAGELWALIDRSVRQLQAADYSRSQLDAAIGSVYGVDKALIDDRTYFVAEGKNGLIGAGGWSRRATLFGVHQLVRDERRLVPGQEPARIRAFFVDPAWARRGVATAILAACEDAARQEGFTRAALAATLTGLPFYRRHGYADKEPIDTPLPNGETIAFVAMEKAI